MTACPRHYDDGDGRVCEGSELPPGGNDDDERAASLVDVLGATALLSPCAPPLQRGMWAGCLIQGDVGDGTAYIAYTPPSSSASPSSTFSAATPATNDMAG
ncbi:hypothetical protein BJ912DRAFT_1143989 [Pholiota molesta]|nr:hypothetical protein BJ912DRAFT_1143989 [Pholiota molesta]